MTKYSFAKTSLVLPLFLCLLTSCKGQSAKDISIDSTSKSTSGKSIGPKLVKTQGSDEYQNICCGLQDKSGRLWFGTSAEGLYCYDGKTFTQYTMADGLTCNSVRCLLEDREGNIWIGTRDGLCIFDGKTITTMLIPKDYMTALNSSITYYSAQSTKETVWSMLQDKSGKIWLGTGDGVYCYDGKHFRPFLDKGSIINKNALQLKVVFDMLEDKNGNIWLASGMLPGEEGICRYDGKTLQSFKPGQEGWFRKIIEDRNGNLIFATRKNGVLFCDLSADPISESSFLPFPQPPALLNNSLTTILKDKSGNIWVASAYGKNKGDTLGGAWYFNPSAAKATMTKVTNREVLFMLEDKSNFIWLATSSTGLYRYDGKNMVSFTEEK
ncbi:MAG: two-component regulator propeller domain-containing protein [Chitinophagaceae bacterium]|jgi:ligand-binding sensor domain-containing protein